MTRSPRIVVVGAGVTGLTTALLLKRRGYDVDVIAKWLPGDLTIEYTSPWAGNLLGPSELMHRQSTYDLGAHWRTMAPNTDIALQKMDAISYQTFMELAMTLSKETGVMQVPSFDYYDDIVPETQAPWFQHIVKDFQFVPPSAMPQGAKIGHQYTTVVINTPHYLKWLLQQFSLLGGTVRRQTLSDLSEAFEPGVDAVVNCTGLGARQLVSDDTVFPTRGQTVIVEGPHIQKTMTHIGEGGKGFITYVIPRSDGTVVLGGTAQKNDFTATADEETAKSILRRTQALCPELTSHGPLKIVRHAVGLRPSRTGGVRVENEQYRM
ncbi:hypothetical protein DFQ28_005498 [Apophysomyces sp. BC1034]|nr:hypothetical protein DFQ28_005498 [Apophysomyces sp. BC1034]